MNDLEKLLSEDGRTWQAPPAAGPDLAGALARSAARRSRLGAGATLVVLVALATGGALFLRGGPGIPATPVPMSTPTASTRPSPTGEATAPPSAAPSEWATDPAVGRDLHEPPTKQELAEVVHDTAVQRGIPVKVDAVRTTLDDATSLMQVKVGGWAPTTQVWLVEVRGEFSCGPCTPTQTGPEAGVGVLTMALKATDLQQIALTMGDEAHDLSTLGTVVRLDPEAAR